VGARMAKVEVKAAHLVRSVRLIDMSLAKD
jgi:hypothetical protein